MYLYIQREAIMIASWVHTCAGPELWVCGVKVNEWLGTRYDPVCQTLCEQVNHAYTEYQASQTSTSSEKQS